MKRKHALGEFLVSISFLLLGASSGSAQTPGDWWPDPATQRGLSVWLPFSREYDTLYSDLDTNPEHDLLVQTQIAEMDRERVEVAFLTFSSGPDRPHLQALSDRGNPVTRDVRSFLNRLKAMGIRACAAIFSDTFTGSPSFLDRYVLVDHLVAFNANRDLEDAPFGCVTTDLEMQDGSPLRVYDLWKQFHLNMKNRIAASGSDLALLTWMQGPDFLVSHINPADRDELMTREGIAETAPDSGLFNGAIRYFTTAQDGPDRRAIFDAVVPMWYFASNNPDGAYARRLRHNLDELQSMSGEKPFLIAGIMIRNDTGLCCVDRVGNPVCIRSRAEYDARLDFNDTFRSPGSVFIGTGLFKWPIPEDWNCRLAASSGAVDQESCRAR